MCGHSKQEHWGDFSLGASDVGAPPSFLVVIMSTKGLAPPAASLGDDTAISAAGGVS